MSTCEHCDRDPISGSHSRRCPLFTPPAPEQETYTEVTGNIVVHHDKPANAVMIVAGGRTVEQEHILYLSRWLSGEAS